MTLPKFIITMERLRVGEPCSGIGYFRLGMIRSALCDASHMKNQHKHLLKPGDQCIGGGYYHFDFVSNHILLDRESYDFGRPKCRMYITNNCGSYYRKTNISSARFILCCPKFVPSFVPSSVPSLSPACPQLSEGQLEKIENVIKYLLSASGSITELMKCAGEKNKNRFRQTILKTLVEAELVEPTIKDVPNSPKQKYSLTDKGREKLQAIS